MAMTRTTSIFLVAFVLCLNLVFILTFDGVQGARLINEDFEIERQLKVLNKPAVKTIHTEWGDIVDCVDIHKQPALDHPLLKDHKIQLKPNFTFKKRSFSQTTERKSSVFRTLNDECPEGTVPIRRTTKADLLIRVKSISKREVSSAFGESKANSIYPGESMVGLALAQPGETYDAASANISTYSPAVAPDQFSSAEVVVESGANEETNSIRFGWMVNPQLFGTNEPRLFVRWTSDNFKSTGCYNTICSGWFQTSTKVYPGIPFGSVSTYNGKQEMLYGLLYQDPTSKNWWLVLLDSEVVGYWPSTLFTNLNSGATKIFWGGHVKAGADQISPPMGSGHVPYGEGGLDLEPGSTFDDLKYSTTTMEERVAPPDTDISYVKECGNLYGEIKYGYSKQYGYTFSYGGGSGKCT